MRRRPLPEALAPDPREARLPLPLPVGLRNFGHAGEAPEAARWRGLGGLATTEAMLEQLAEAMAAAVPRAAPDGGLRASLARFVAADVLTLAGEPRGWASNARAPLTLATLYGDGPVGCPERYGHGAGGLAPWRLRRAGAHGDAGPLADPRAAGDAPTGGEVEALLLDLHDLALARLGGVAVGAARFAAARRLTQALYRRAVLEDLLPALARADAAADCAARLGPEDAAADSPEAPAELVHLALPLMSGDAARPGRIAAALCDAAEAGVMSVAALCRAAGPRLARLANGAPWLAADPAARAAAVGAWAARHAPALAETLSADPPPGFFLWLERQAPAVVGGGDGRRLGALGSLLAAECLWAFRRRSEAAIESAADLPAAMAATFPFADPGRGLDALAAAMGRAR